MQYSVETGRGKMNEPADNISLIESSSHSSNLHPFSAIADNMIHLKYYTEKDTQRRKATSHAIE